MLEINIECDLWNAKYSRPFPSCFEPHYKSEAKCKDFVMKISFHSYANKTKKFCTWPHFHSDVHSNSEMAYSSSITIVLRLCQSSSPLISGLIRVPAPKHLELVLSPSGGEKILSWTCRHVYLALSHARTRSNAVIHEGKAVSGRTELHRLFPATAYKCINILVPSRLYCNEQHNQVYHRVRATP